MHYWQLGDSPYWGHNAIIRVEPFMRTAGCRASRASRRSAATSSPRLRRGGAARPRAAGRSGSRSICREAGRRRPARCSRRCSATAAGVRGTSSICACSSPRVSCARTAALFLNGDLLLRLGGALARIPDRLHGRGGALGRSAGPNYFPTGRSLFPTWPVWRPERVERAVRVGVHGAPAAEGAGGRARADPAPRGQLRRRVRAVARASCARRLRRRCSRRSACSSTAAS